ncbi:MAG: signal transduction histidine kinase, partial [Hyphomicrobiales bacterium]|nr:signal transduction histidine kinase [Hyphomicrobiales bacterium]
MSTSVGTVSLPPDLARIVADNLASGRFRSGEDVLRAALALLAPQTQVQAEPFASSAAHPPSVSARRLRAILQSAIDYAIVTTDMHGVVTSWNSGAARIFGWSEDDAIGRRLSIIFTPEDDARGVPDAEMKVAFARGSVLDARWHVRRDGARFWADGETMALRDEETGA